jgi:hypothetical protein
MTDIEIDVERVRAVHAALGERDYVWVAAWQNRDGEGFDLFNTESGARARLLEWLDEEQEDLNWSEEDFNATRTAIALGECNEFNDEGDRWYSIATEIVNP